MYCSDYLDNAPPKTCNFACTLRQPSTADTHTWSKYVFPGCLRLLRKECQCLHVQATTQTKENKQSVLSLCMKQILTPEHKYCELMHCIGTYFWYFLIWYDRSQQFQSRKRLFTTVPFTEPMYQTVSCLFTHRNLSGWLMRYYLDGDKANARH